MIFTETRLKGAFTVQLEKREDERGFFARAWCQKEFEANGLATRMAQANLSFNKKKGILRGMHYQVPPFQEVKLVRCTRGAIYDVIIDLRPGSATRKQWVAVKLAEKDHIMLYVPEGFAHGFQSLEDGTEVFYQVSQFYSPAHERGVRWNDPAFSIKWPETETRLISAKDKSWPDYPLQDVPQ